MTPFEKIMMISLQNNCVLLITFFPFFHFSAIFGVPLEICVEQYARAALDFSKRPRGSIKEIHFIDIKEDVIAAIQEKFALCTSDRDHSRPSSQAQSKAMSSLPETVVAGSIPSPNADASMLKLKSESVLKHGRSVITFKHKRQVKHTLMLYQDDIMKAQTDAVVVVIDRYGGGGKLHELLKKTVKDKDAYTAEIRFKLKSWNNVGDVFVTGGSGSNFKFVVHVIFPFGVQSKDSALRKQKMTAAYESLLTKCTEENNLSSLAITLFGIGEILYFIVSLDVSDTVHILSTCLKLMAYTNKLHITF